MFCVYMPIVIIVGVCSLFLLIAYACALDTGGKKIPFSLKKLKIIYPVSKHRINLDDMPKVCRPTCVYDDQWITLKLSFFSWLGYLVWRRKIKNEEKKIAQNEAMEEVIKILLSDIKEEYAMSESYFEQILRKAGAK